MCEMVVFKPAEAMTAGLLRPHDAQAVRRGNATRLPTHPWVEFQGDHGLGEFTAGQAYVLVH
jgi:hypothetical protein